ncbi:MAG: hypothetical protein ABSG53_20935 [Thermoguttaceae bacterium]
MSMVRRLSRPSLEQTYRFAWFVAEAHSWYKHLPTDRKVPFFFYLDPCAGMNLVRTPTGEQAMVEINDQSTRFHYTWQTTSDYRRRFGHWNYLARYGMSFRFASDGGEVDTDGAGAAVLDEEGNWIEVPKLLLEAGKAEVNAFTHAYMIGWWPQIAVKGKRLPKFLGEPVEKRFLQAYESPDRPAEPFRNLIEQRLARAADRQKWADLGWFGSEWFDEVWDETFKSLGGSEADLDAALSWLQRRLVIANAEVKEFQIEGVPVPLALAYERNRQLDAMRSAMLRVLILQAFGRS